MFYAVFYFVLGSFFVGMLAVFYQIMPKDRPTYFGESGTIGLKGVNPGLGFRPQINVEAHQIAYNPLVHEGRYGFKVYAQNLQNFLDSSLNALLFFIQFVYRKFTIIFPRGQNAKTN